MMEPKENATFFRKKFDSAEPLFYFGLILQRNETQCLKLLKYIVEKNKARVIYQRRSLTYLYIVDQKPEDLK